MEIFKVNSPELIGGAGGNEDIFDALNSPDAHIFSLQRFAVSLRQSGGSATTLLSSESLTGVLSAWTLGRSASESITAGSTVGTASSSSVKVSDVTIYIAPLVSNDGKTGSNTALGGSVITDTSYKFTAYQVGSDTHIALQYDGLPLQTSTKTGSGAAHYYIGIAAQSDVGFFDSDATFLSTDYSSTGYTYTEGSYTSVYKSMVWDNDIRQGSVTSKVASATGWGNIYLDFYDVKLSTANSEASTDSSTLTLGSYTYRATSSDRSIDFLKETELTFDNIGSGESEAYKINSIGLTFSGTSNHDATATLKAGSYAITDAQTFSGIGFSSDVSVTFDITGVGSGTGISLNGGLYKSNNNSGTITFGASGTTNYIGLGSSGLFLMSSGIATDGTVYKLSGTASGTFVIPTAANTFLLGLDVGQEDNINVTSFTAGAASATVVAVDNNSNITLAGTFSAISGTSVYNLEYTLSDTTKAVIGGYSFTDTQDSSPTIVHFTTKEASNTLVGGITLSNQATVSGTTQNMTFTLSNTGLYTINDYTFSATAVGGASAENDVTFSSTKLTYDTTHSGTSFGVTYTDASSLNIGTNINMSGAFTIAQSEAWIFDNVYVGAAGEALTYSVATDSAKTISITGTGAEISGVSDNSLIGVSSRTFTAASGGTFFLADGGSSTKINGLIFNEVSDGTITKLTVGTNAATVQGALILDSTTSNASTVYTLVDFEGGKDNASGTSAITINDLRFSGSDVTVQNDAANNYLLLMTNETTYSITGSGSKTAQSTFNLQDNSIGQFDFGGIHVVAETAIGNDSSGVNVKIGSNTVLASATTISQITIGTSDVAVADGAKGSDPYTIKISEKGVVTGIEDIDTGTTITKVAGASYVLTTVGSETGMYTFSTSSLGSKTQVFNISGDTDGVKFWLDSDGTVQSITGLDAATVHVTDSTKTNSLYSHKTYNANNNTYTRVTASGKWGVEEYLGYILTQNSTAGSFGASGIESSTSFAHTEVESSTVGAFTSPTFYITNEDAVSGTSMVAFRNLSSTAYGASISTTEVVSLFTGLGTTGSDVGVLVSYNEDSSTYSLAITHGLNENGKFASSTARTDLSANVSLVTSNIALEVYDKYTISGENVTVRASSDVVVVGAAGGSEATVVMADAGSDATIELGVTNAVSTYNINGEHTLTANKSSNGHIYGTNTEIFSLDVSGGAFVEDTVSGTQIAINGITYGAANDSATFRVTSNQNTSVKDVLLIKADQIAVDGTNTGVFANTNIVFTNAEGLGLIFDSASYTGKSVTYALLGSDAAVASGTKQYASIVGGGASASISASYASGTAIVFDGAVYTATSSAFTFNRNASEDILTEGAAMGVLSSTDTIVAGGDLHVLSDTYTLNSGAGLTITFNSSTGNAHSYTVAYDAATGTYTAAANTAFHVSDYYLGVDGAESNSTIFSYTPTAAGGVLNLYIAGTDQTISASGSSIFGTRTTSDTTTTFSIAPEGLDATETQFTYSLIGTGAFSFDSDTKAAAGNFFSGSGTRVFAEGDLAKYGTTTSLELSYVDNPYLPSEGATMTVVVSAGSATETFTSGAGVFETSTGGVFNFALNGNLSDSHTYTAISAIKLEAYFTDSKTAALTAVSGSGTRLSEGTANETYVINELASDTYTMSKGSTIQLTLDNISGTELFTAGTGTLALSADKNVFHVADDYLSGTTTGDTVYEYTATTGTLTYTFVDGDKVGTIALGEVEGTRAFTATDTTYDFTFKDTKYTADSGTSFVFNINADIASSTGAVGNVYEGSGYRGFAAADSATTFVFTSDTYALTAGNIDVSIVGGFATETAQAGATATFYANTTTGTGTYSVFHFAIGDKDAQAYTATALTTLEGVIGADGTVTSLISASGAGVRTTTGTDTFAISVLSETFVMDSGATVALSNISVTDGVGAGTETFTAGTGTYTANAEAKTFTIADDFLKGVTDITAALEKVYTYNVATEGTLTLTLDTASTTKIALSDALVGTRDADSDDTSFTFETDASGTDLEYTLVDSSSAVFQLVGASATKVGAIGTIFTGEGKRATKDGEDLSGLSDIVFNEDTYTADKGTLKLSVKEGAKVSEELVGGTATYVADLENNKEFHFAPGDTVFTYQALDTTTLKIAVDLDVTDGATATLLSASGSGTRTLGEEDKETYAISSLGDNEYVFTNGAGVKLDLAITSAEDTSTFTETAYSGSGSYSPTSGTAIVMFDSEGTVSSTNVVYSYTSFTEATFSITLEDGNVTKQEITSGSASRTGTTEIDATFIYGDDNTVYSTTSTHDSSGETNNLVFMLDSDKAKITGAAGYLTAGFGFRNASDEEKYTVAASSNTYTLQATDEFKLTVDATEGSSEALFYASTTTTFSDQDSFTYDGTKFTASGTVVLRLDATDGEVSEAGVSGKGIFSTTDASETFTYDSNVYNVDPDKGAKLSVTFPDSQSVKFEEGAGNRALKVDDTYTFADDGNVYTMSTAGTAFISVAAGGDDVVQNLDEGTGTAKYSEGDSFNYSVNGVSNTYKATSEGAEINLYGRKLDAEGKNGAYVALTDGSGTREDSDTATFTFEGNEYDKVADTALTWTLALESGTAVENVTGAEGTRTVAKDVKFAYQSPLSEDGEVFTYTSLGATLQIKLKDGAGTETLTTGSATRTLDSGKTFDYAPTKLGGSQTLTFTATQDGLYTLTLENKAGETEGVEMSFMGYNITGLQETVTDGVGSGTTTESFSYVASVVTDTVTYTPVDGGVSFNLTVSGGANTATWLAGSATMTLDADKEFTYTAANIGEAKTYTVGADKATFTRFGEENSEYLSDGSAYRAATTDDVYTVTYLANTFSVDSGTNLVLTYSGSETLANEALGAGSATFTGTTFNYLASGASHTYTAEADVTLQIGLDDKGATTTLLAASGTGTREFDAGETGTHLVLTDEYTINSGTYTLTLTNDNMNNAEETLTAGAGVFTADSGDFHLNDVVLGNGTDSTTYTYTVVEGSGVTLALTFDGDTNTVKFESGMGTRNVSDNTFTYNDTVYSSTATTGLDYAISADSATAAAGYLYNAVGTRDGVDSNTTFVYQSDTYHAQDGTMQLSIENGAVVGDGEIMLAGTATYVAEADKDVFHFNYNNAGVKEYAAISQTTLTATFTADNTEGTLASINGAGTRTATASDTSFTIEFLTDTYNAVAGSSTILFTATGDTNTASETILSTAGSVQDVIDDSNKVFHYAPDNDVYEYTAQSNTVITLTLSESESVQSFSENPYATRTASDTTFTLDNVTYTNTATNETFLLTGSGTDLTDSLWIAQGERAADAGDLYTSTVTTNVYTLTEGIYSIDVTEGAGAETLTSGAGSQTYATGASFKYGDSSTSYIANIEGATLGVTVANSTPTESLTAGAGFDGVDKYIMVDGANVALQGSNNATLSAVATDSGTLIELTATTATGLTAATNVASFAATVDANGDILIKDIDYTAVDAQGTLAISSALDAFSATGTFSAEGDFTASEIPSYEGKKVGIAEDTDVAVVFTADGITELDKLSDGVKVNDAAGATKAVTDSTGTFVFASTLESGAHTQNFTVKDDESVTFQIDSATGLVTGIKGLDVGASVIIIDTDTSASETITIDVGKTLERNSATGLWTTADVVADNYLIALDSAGSRTVYAIDAQGDLTVIEDSIVGTASSDGSSFTVNEEAIANGKSIFVTNASSGTTISLGGAVNVGAIGSLSGAIQVNSDTAATAGMFNTGSLDSGNNFISDNVYTVAGGTFNVGDGAITVAGNGASIYANDTSKGINLLASDTASAFTVQDDEVAVTVTADADGGFFKAQLTEGVVTGLTPNLVSTGNASIQTNADGTTFAINEDTVKVENDDDGMKLLIENDKLVGLSDISTDATITPSGLEDGAQLAINGNDPIEATNGTPIKYNETADKWLTGDAPAIEGATGYLISVTAGEELQLYYTTADSTDLKRTKNVNDFKAVFVGKEPSEDGETVGYDALTINSSLSSDASISVASGINDAVEIKLAGDDVARALALVTSGATYTINEQQLIPNTEATVVASGTGIAIAQLTSVATFGHDSMTFGATNEATAVFGGDTIILSDSAKVTNTNDAANFEVYGTVAFDGIVVKADSLVGSSVSGVDSTGAALTVDGKPLIIAGGDTAYTVDVTSNTAVISGIDGDATVEGVLAGNATINTASTGTFKVASSDAFSIAGDSEVSFITENDTVTGIANLSGTVAGNFENEVTVDSGKVQITNDSVVSLTADGTVVSAINGVGKADDTVKVVYAGGASTINTDANGTFDFGLNDVKSYTVTDADSQVSFLATHSDFVPSVSGVSGLNDGSIVLVADDTLKVNDNGEITLGGVSDKVTINVASDAITSVDGLQGSVNGLNAGVSVQAISSNVSINGAKLAIDEGNGTATIVANAIEGGFDTVTGLNANATVSIAANASIVTEENGAFTFDANSATYTISGDPNGVTFVTDANSRVADIEDLSGTLQMTATATTVNGAAVAVDRAGSDAAVSDVSITGTGSGVGAVTGLSDGDSVTVPTGASVVMNPGSDTDTTTTLTVNGKEYGLKGDAEGVTITPNANGVDDVDGLDAGASLVLGNTAGTYNVNGTPIVAGVGATIIGDAEGAAHLYDPTDVDISGEDTPEDVVDKITGIDSSDTDTSRYVESLSSDQAADILGTDTSKANGNIQMALTNSDTTQAQTADFSQTTGIKKVTLESGAQDVTFNNAGGNIAIVSGSTDESPKNINLGNGGDIAVIGVTEAPINVTAGRGKDTVVAQGGGKVTVDLRAGGAARVMANGVGTSQANVDLEGYDHNTGAGVQVTNSDIKKAVKSNTIQLEDGSVTVNNGKINLGNTSDGASVVNLYDLKGRVTKVAFTNNEGVGNIDLSNERSNLILKGNYTEGGAKRKDPGEGNRSSLKGGSGDDYALVGAGDNVDLGEGNNEIVLDSDTRTNDSSGAIISQTATRGTTTVENFHNDDFSGQSDGVSISPNAGVKLVGGVLRFALGAASLILNGIKTFGSGSADLAESNDADDNATAVDGKVEYAPLLLNGVKTAVASDNNWIGADTLWSDEENMPLVLVGGDTLGSGVDLRGFEGEVALTLPGAGESSDISGNIGNAGIYLRDINKVRLGTGNSTVVGSSEENNTIVAGLGNSNIWGGGESNDVLIGRQDGSKTGSTSFRYLNGDGRDTISNFEYLTSDNESTADKIDVTNQAFSNIVISGSDVVVGRQADTDRLTIKNAVGKDAQVVFDNNGVDTILTAQIATTSLNFDNLANFYYAAGKNASVVADSSLSSVAAYLDGYDFLANRNDTFVGDIKYLSAASVEGSASLVGNSNNNTLIGGKESSSMWGGWNGGDDSLVGGTGVNTFFYGKNNGNDVVSNVKGDDLVYFYDVSLDDVAGVDITTSSITVSLKDSAGGSNGGSIVINSNNTGVGLRDANGTVWTVDQRTEQWTTKQ